MCIPTSISEVSIPIQPRSQPSEEIQLVIEPNSVNRWSAKPTRLVVSLDDDERIVALESTRGGVTPLLLERYLERVRLDRFRERTADITPLASSSFLEEVEAFERIRLAAVEVSRPNYDWSDHANNLYQLADESGAQSSTTEVKAPRGESLNKNGGLVKVIRDVASAANASIQNAQITGRKPGDVNDQTVSLEKHQERASIPVDTSLPLDQQSTNMLVSFRGLIDGLRTRRDADD